VHTLDLPAGNGASDRAILGVARDEQRVVITKDTDFFDTWLLQKQPAKLLLVTTGNITNDVLLEMFDRNLSTICTLLATNSLVELNTRQLFVHG
jgi:predicted nuclease of predicted toxin-antitoxin system